MYSFVLVTTMLAATNSPAQPPSPQPFPPLGGEGRARGAGERLVPIPQGGPPPAPQLRVADKPVSVDAPATDVVLHWNEVILGAIKVERTPPPQAARNLAIVHAAIYDAMNAVHRTHRAYRVRARPEGDVSADVAAAIAAHRTLIELYPRQVEQFDAALDATLEIVPEGPTKQRGVTLGQQVAEQILAWRADDGSRRQVRYTPSSAPGLWRPTLPGRKAALLPQWRYLKPFAMPGTDRFMPAAPPGLDTAAYTEAFLEVKEIGARDSQTRTADQTRIAWFWDDGAGSVTPPGHWNRIAQTVARRQRLTPADNARLFALLNISMADAAILCWEGKFGFKYWRPITAIRAADRDDNADTTPDRDWNCLLETPPFPSYPSGHSTFSGAAATALARFFGTDAIRFRIGSDGTPGVTRDFAGFWAAAEEAGRSRIYGGIHYEFDNQEGLRTGRDLADHIARHVLLRAESGDLTSLKLIPTRSRHFSIGLADRPRGEARPLPRGR